MSWVNVEPDYSELGTDASDAIMYHEDGSASISVPKLHVTNIVRNGDFTILEDWNDRELRVSEKRLGRIISLLKESGINSKAQAIAELEKIVKGE